MKLFPQDALNPGVQKREVFGWAMYDFANSGYTTVVLTAVFGAYFVGVVAGGAAWGTLAWTLAISASSLIVMLTTPAIGAYADLKAAKKPLLALSTAGCVLATAALAAPGRGDVGIALAAVVVSFACRASSSSRKSRLVSQSVILMPCVPARMEKRGGWAPRRSNTGRAPTSA